MANITKWEPYGRGVWKSGTGGWGEIKITRGRVNKKSTYHLMTSPWTGEGIVMSTHTTLAAAKKAGEAYVRSIQRERNPMAKKKAKRKTKRKATPAQLRALARGRATAARNRKKKAPKRKKVARRRNPAYGNYQAARAVARGSRRVNPVRPLGAKMFFVMRGARYFTGYSFSQQKGLAVHYTSIGAAKAAAQKLANKTGTAIRIVDARK